MGNLSDVKFVGEHLAMPQKVMKAEVVKVEVQGLMTTMVEWADD